MIKLNSMKQIYNKDLLEIMPLQIFIFCLFNFYIIKLLLNNLKLTGDVRYEDRF